MKALSALGISQTPWSMKTWQASDDYGTIVESANHNTVCDCSWSALGDEQGEVDARLIAAAPELYEALRRLLAVARNRLPSQPTLDEIEVLQMVYSAIAKASGEEAR